MQYILLQMRMWQPKVTGDSCSWQAFKGRSSLVILYWHTSNFDQNATKLFCIVTANMSIRFIITFNCVLSIDTGGQTLAKMPPFVSLLMIKLFLRHTQYHPIYRCRSRRWWWSWLFQQGPNIWRQSGQREGIWPKTRQMCQIGKMHTDTWFRSLST